MSSKRKKQPLKPPVTFGSIVFSKDGRVRPNFEDLPRVQEDIELTIGKKFAGALKHFYGQTLEDLKKVEDSADLMCVGENEAEVRIQVAEVVWQKRRTIDNRRQTYLRKIEADISEVLELFSGYRLSIADAGDEPFLPPLKSKEGQAHLLDLVSKLKELGEGLATLADGKRRIRKWKIGSLQIMLVADCERIAPQGEYLPLVRWTGAYVYRDDERLSLIADEIKKKIKKGYAKSSAEFWLLVYSVDILPKADDPEVDEARKLLRSMQHPFDQVWFFFPYSNQDLGHLIPLFLREG